MRQRAGIGFFCAGAIACCFLIVSQAWVRAAEADLAGAATAVPEGVPSDKGAGFQEEQDVIQQAIEQLRREANSASRPGGGEGSNDPGSVQRDAENLSARLGLIEQTLTLQHQRELEVLQGSHRTILLIAGVFAGVGLIGILCSALILVRAMNRISEMVVSFPLGRALGQGHSLVALGAGELHPVAAAPDQINTRFLDAIDRLERRIADLEHTAHPTEFSGESAPPASHPKALPSKAAGPVSDAGPQFSITALRSKKGNSTPTGAPASANSEQTAQIAMLVGKGQALLNLGEAKEAIECFDKVLAVEPDHTDALVRRGMALEKLQKMEEAIDSYDRAIAVNNSMTLAYLYKGAVCNKLQRFREALECYEKALKSEQKPATS